MSPKAQPPTQVDSPFYVRPSDNPNLVTISSKIDGNNHIVWIISMCRVLGAKKNLTIIDGSMEILDFDDLNRAAWEQCNHLVHSWIINYVSDSISQTIIFHQNSIDVWNDLKEIFSKIDRVRVAHLRFQLNNMKQGGKIVLE